MNDRKKKLFEYYKANRYEAHQFLFRERHKNEPAPYQKELIELLNDPNPLVAAMAFRGGAKSTFVEEYVLLCALFGDIKYAFLVGPKWESACDRLVSIRNELENNDRLIDIFGDQKSEPWSLGELVLVNGVKLQAVGAGQSMRGKKYKSERPDLAVIDDLEDEDSVRTDDALKKMDRWLAGTLRPALNRKTGKIRFLGTPLHPKALIFSKTKDKNWKSKTFPVIYLDEKTGEEKSIWPSQFPMDAPEPESCLRKLRDEYMTSGNALEWQQEYMCVSEDIAAKPFQSSMIKIQMPEQSWMPKMMFVDPARTVNTKTSARTGYALWSWWGNRLIVHEAEGHFHKPDEVIKKILDWDEKHQPVAIGVEMVGLEEWLGQPLRAACIAAGRNVPYMDVRAPRDKISFIKGLQPSYNAGEVIHAHSLPDLEQELLAFPTGRMDVLNALAYALRMRAGRPVYDDFTFRHIASLLEPKRNQASYLCVSSRPALTAAVLIQYIDGAINIYKDWVYTQPPKECFGQLIHEAAMEAGGKIKILAPLEQFDTWNNNGLPAAIKSLGHTPTKTASSKNCEGALRPWLQQQVHGQPKIMVEKDCRWVINGFSSGYARKLDKHGHISDTPTDDQYRVIMECLESFVTWMSQSSILEDGDDWNYAIKGNRKYITLQAET